MLSFGGIIYFMLSFDVIIFWCCHLMLSFGVIIWCYHLFYVTIWCYHCSQFANVIIFVLSFFLVQDGCYHLCYHLMLSFFVIISPLFSFSWKHDTLFHFYHLIQPNFIFKDSVCTRTMRNKGFQQDGNCWHMTIDILFSFLTCRFSSNNIFTFPFCMGQKLCIFYK